MKRIATLLALLSSASLLASSATAVIHVTGLVTETITLDISETSGYNALDLNNSITDQEIARINIASNAKDGFTLACSTSNDLAFKGSGSAQQMARYTLKYLNSEGIEKNIGKKGDGADITYTDGSGALIEDVASQNAITSVSNRTLKISYDNAGLLWEPDFTDTITLTLTSK